MQGTGEFSFTRSYAHFVIVRKRRRRNFTVETCFHSWLERELIEEFFQHSLLCSVSLSFETSVRQTLIRAGSA